MDDSVSSTRPSKLAKLHHFKAKMPAHTQAALAAMIKEAQETGLPEVSSSKHQTEARRQLLDECQGGSLGPIIQTATLLTAKGEECTMFFANFLVYLAAIYSRGGSFCQMVQRKHQSTPSGPTRPWNLILYTDELCPGNVLGRAERKTWTVYATFLEFQDQLCHEDAWLTLACERSTFVATLEAGVSQMVATILQSIFCNQIVDPSCGYLLKHATGDTRLHFRFSMMLADGAAQKQVWGSKGDAGTKFCFLCANVRATGTSEENHHCNITRYNQLVLTTDAAILQSYATLDQKRDRCSKKEFDLWQQATGWTWSAKALLLDQSLLARNVLHPVSQFCHDYMHGVLQGTAPIVLYHFLVAVSSSIKVWGHFERYCAFWRLPSAWKCNHVASLFSKKKETNHKNNEKFSCQASECLAIYPIVRHWVHMVVAPAGHAPKACQALLAMAAVIDQVHGGNQWHVITKDTLLPAMEESIQSFRDAFPELPLIKKWHWQLHLPDSLARFGLLPSCFTAERKHKTIGKLATNLLDTTSFEKRLLEQVVATEVTKLDERDLFPEGVLLTKPKSASKKTLATLQALLQEPLQQATCSLEAKVRGATCYKGDIILYQTKGQSPPWQVAEIQLHVCFHGVATTLVKVWTLEQYVPHQQYALCQICEDNVGFIPTGDILLPVVCSKSSPKAKVLLPYQIYSKDLLKMLW